MRDNRRTVRLRTHVRRLRTIGAESPAPESVLPLASFVVRSAAPPRVTAEVRPVQTGRARGWQVTVRAHDVEQRLATPPQFAITRLRASGRHVRARRRSLLVNNAFRPRWIARDPEPRLTRRLVAGVLMHRGKRLTPLSRQGHLDNRREYRDTAYPWGCVCKVMSAGRSGSGVLIGPRHVLTASHVIDWAAGWAIVEVHRFDSTFVAGSCCTRLTAFTKIPTTNPTHSTVDEDYAVLTLADRLGDQFGWMGNMTYDSDYDDKPIFRTIGYANDIAGGNRPVYERDFHLDEDEFDLGEARAMTCGADFETGQSGSPIFGFGAHDDMPYVVAVASAEGGNGNNYCAGGSWLTKLVREARQLDP
jgi:V8-like Glu-specific endopeptidase